MSTTPDPTEAPLPTDATAPDSPGWWWLEGEPVEVFWYANTPGSHLRYTDAVGPPHRVDEVGPWQGRCFTVSDVAQERARLQAESHAATLALEADLQARYEPVVADLREQVAALEAHELAVARAIGVVYEADGHNDQPGPRADVVEAVRKAARDSIEIGQLRDDVDHLTDAREKAETRAQASAERARSGASERADLRSQVERLTRERDEANRALARASASVVQTIADVRAAERIAREETEAALALSVANTSKAIGRVANAESELAVLKRVHAQHVHDAADAMREAGDAIAKAKCERDEARAQHEQECRAHEASIANWRKTVQEAEAEHDETRRGWRAWAVSLADGPVGDADDVRAAVVADLRALHGRLRDERDALRAQLTAVEGERHEAREYARMLLWGQLPPEVRTSFMLHRALPPWLDAALAGTPEPPKDARERVMALLMDESGDGDDMERRDLDAADIAEQHGFGPRDDESTAEWADRMRTPEPPKAAEPRICPTNGEDCRNAECDHECVRGGDAGLHEAKAAEPPKDPHADHGYWCNCDRCLALPPEVKRRRWGAPNAAEPRPLHLTWNGTEWVDDRCGCRYHPDDDNGSHGGAPHVHRCERHTPKAADPPDRQDWMDRRVAMYREQADEARDARDAAESECSRLREALRDVRRLLAAQREQTAGRWTSTRLGNAIECIDAVLAEHPAPTKPNIADAWVVLNFKSDVWWRANHRGYTSELLSAGVYTEADAKACQRRRPTEDRAQRLSDALAGLGEGTVGDLIGLRPCPHQGERT